MTTKDTLHNDDKQLSLVRADKVDPQALVLARESRGLTQKELARVLDLGQGTLSKIEAGLLDFNMEQLDDLVRVLDYPRSFFLEPKPYMTLGVGMHRSRKTIKVSIRKQARARINVLCLAIHKLLISVDLPDTDVPEIDLGSSERHTPKSVAQELRVRWCLPPGPIEDLVGEIEARGILVIPFDFGTDKIDGLSFDFGKVEWPPMIFINKHAPGDRQRFTLAHELAHIILHHHLSMPPEDMEEEADEFASEFLLPSSDIRPHLMDLSLSKAARLKPHWKASIQALLMKAAEVDAITSSRKRSLYVQLSRKGWRKKEPGHIPQEQPQVFYEVFNLHLNDLGYTPVELAEAIGLSVNDIQDMGIGPQTLRLVR